MPEKEKTGQHIDALKSGLLNPLLAEEILKIPHLPKELSFIDVGTGDSSTAHNLLATIVAAGHRIENLGMVDVDIAIFPEMLRVVLASEASALPIHHKLS